MRTFAYCRVSTDEQHTANQVAEIAAAGFTVEPKRVFSETISGSSAVAQRPVFMKLLDKLDQDDVLIVTKLDRLGRNAMDVVSTVDRLAEIGVHLHCLQLGGTDLTSPAGRMLMQVISAMAEFEKGLLLERTKQGLERAWSAGKVSGRKHSLSERQRASVRAKLAEGSSVAAIARELKVSRMTVMRARAEAAQVTP